MAAFKAARLSVTPTEVAVVAAVVGNGEVAVLGRQLEQSRQAIVELTMIMNEQREATALLHSKLDLAEDNRKADAKAAARVAEAAVKSGAATEKRRGKERAEDMNSEKIREAKRGRERVEDKAAIKEQERKQAEDRAEDQKLAAEERLAESDRAKSAEVSSHALLMRLLSSNDGLNMMAIEIKEAREARLREAEAALAGKKGSRARKAVGEGKVED
jgi:hypothetical protein